jgi:hypothetical protein
MKRLTNCMTTAAAVLMITAGASSAQSVMKAEVPFAFHVAGKVMEPGTVRVQLLNRSGAGIVAVRNDVTKRGYIVLPKSIGDAPKQWVASGSPILGFDCSTGACFLAKVWAGTGSAAYTMYPPKTKSGEVQLTEIVMTLDRGN